MFKLFRRPETDQQIKERVLKLCKKGDYDICPPSMNANVAIDELKNFFLGEDWYVVMPIGHEQVITEIVCAIEMKCKAFTSFHKRETDKQIQERISKLCKNGDYAICPQPMNANVAINELKNFFLGEDWYVVMPIEHEQVITEIVYAIETKYKRLKVKK